MEYTGLQIRIPRLLDYELNIILAELKRDQLKKTKAELVIELLRIGCSQMQKINKP